MNRTLVLLLAIALLLITAHRLPAPISEIPESPTPATTVAPTAKPRSKPSPKPKRKSDASQPATSPATQHPTAKQSLFAGTWVGTIPAFPTGPQETVLKIDPKETTMLHTWTGHPPTNVAKAEISADTIRATFQNGAVTFTFSVTPQSDSTTARVRLQAFMNDNTAAFHRVAESAAAKPQR